MSKKIRITNTTVMHANGNPGFGLEFQGNYIAPNRPLVLDLPVIPVTLEEWQAKGWIRIEDADAAPVSKPGEAVVTPGTVVGEARASQVLKKEVDDLMEEEEIDFSIAKEATLPSTEASAGILQSHAQEQAKASVSLGMAEETVPADQVSPIPGDRPKSVDNADKFTVRAPRSKGVGAVVKA